MHFIRHIIQKNKHATIRLKLILHESFFETVTPISPENKLSSICLIFLQRMDVVLKHVIRRIWSNRNCCNFSPRDLFHYHLFSFCFCCFLNQMNSMLHFRQSILNFSLFFNIISCCFSNKLSAYAGFLSSIYFLISFNGIFNWRKT